jgi:UDP-N-acetylglucosamine transferase subunit ALG13
MIFVTVGTHEQQFDRLVRYVDDFAKRSLLQEECILQTGYSHYKPTHCEYSGFYDFQKMQLLFATARIIITHGGPSSIIQAIGYNKKPIVVPRMHYFDEHVDDHQVNFAGFLHKRNKIILINEIDELEENIMNYDKICKISESPGAINYGDIDSRLAFCHNLEEKLYAIL